MVDYKGTLIDNINWIFDAIDTKESKAEILKRIDYTIGMLEDFKRGVKSAKIP